MKKILNKKETAIPYLLCAPAVILFSVLVVWPFIYAIYLSLFRWDGLGKAVFIGLKNYKYALTDAILWKAFFNTLQYALFSTFFKNILGLALALIVAKKFIGRTLFRTIIYLPVTFSYIVIGVLWSWIYNPIFGLLNSFLEIVNYTGPYIGWLSNPDIALNSIIAVDVWKWVGFHMILYLAGLQGIPKSFYEAADIDGASTIRKFFSITIPQINGTIVVNILLSITGAFVSNYDLVKIMTGGGPYHSTEVMLTHIVNTGFAMNNIGKADAMSFILFLMVLVFGIIQVKTMSKDNNYDN